MQSPISRIIYCTSISENVATKHISANRRFEIALTQNKRPQQQVYLQQKNCKYKRFMTPLLLYLQVASVISDESEKCHTVGLQLSLKCVFIAMTSVIYIQVQLIKFGLSIVLSKTVSCIYFPSRCNTDNFQVTECRGTDRCGIIVTYERT